MSSACGSGSSTSNSFALASMLLISKNTDSHQMALYVQPEQQKSYAIVAPRSDEDRFTVHPSSDSVKLMSHSVMTGLTAAQSVRPVRTTVVRCPTTTSRKAVTGTHTSSTVTARRRPLTVGQTVVAAPRSIVESVARRIVAVTVAGDSKIQDTYQLVWRG